MRTPTRLVLLAAVGSCAAVLPAQDGPRDAPTIADATANAFSYPLPLLDKAERRAFAVGNALFKTNWVASGSSAAGFDGLGPLFNARSCSSCHSKDGRSRPPLADEQERHGLLIRIGVRSDGGPDAPHASYGGQIQDVAVPGAEPEARVVVHDEVRRGSYADGEDFELLFPRYELEDLRYGPLGDHAVLGPRVAQHLVGLGLLEAIPDQRLVSLADADDHDGDGISGRVHRVPRSGTDALAIGRFGWKATQATVLDQTAAAFVNDIGITSPLFVDEALTATQRQKLASLLTEPEIDQHGLERVAFYARTLAVPQQRDRDREDVVAGRTQFVAFGCAKCHVREHVTGEVPFHPGFANLRIEPFTDLLLHDLGPDLADQKRDGEALPSEWRTPPLWGLALVETVNGHLRLLHDGRARGFAEAILWHGGEGEAARECFRNAPATQRSELLAFLKSL